MFGVNHLFSFRRSVVEETEGPSLAVMAVSQKRLHVGGLFEAVTPADLKERLGKYGGVGNVDIVVRRDPSGACPKFSNTSGARDQPQVFCLRFNVAKRIPTLCC